jgi:hypothetical protein
MNLTSELHRKQLIDRKLGHHGLTGMLFNDEIYFAERHRSIVTMGCGLAYTIDNKTPITSLRNGEGYCKVLRLKNEHNGETGAARMMRLAEERDAKAEQQAEEDLKEIIKECSDAWDLSNSQFIEWK